MSKMDSDYLRSSHCAEACYHPYISSMRIQEAIAKADQILDEERMSPTVRYMTDAPVLNPAAPIARAFSERGSHPRTVQSNPDSFLFRSTNYDLLCALLGQVREEDRLELLAACLSRISSTASYRHTSREVLGAGQWRRCSSELPLVAEFTARQGGKHLFIDSLRKAAPSPGLTLLLIQLEEIIALNFTLFNTTEYSALRAAMDDVKRIIAHFERIPRPGPTIESNTVHNVCREAPQICDSISEGCRKAQFFYLRGSLSAGVNLEVNQDKSTVSTFLEKLGFTPLLIQSLDEAEKLYREDATAFDLKSSLGHLRSFLEQLHVQACTAAHSKFGGPKPAKWGEALRYLQENGVLTRVEELFASQFYTLMSDTGVHPLIAEREYARLMRNISVEYGLLLLTKLDKLAFVK